MWAKALWPVSPAFLERRPFPPLVKTLVVWSVEFETRPYYSGLPQRLHRAILSLIIGHVEAWRDEQGVAGRRRVQSVKAEEALGLGVRCGARAHVS